MLNIMQYDLDNLNLRLTIEVLKLIGYQPSEWIEMSRDRIHRHIAVAPKVLAGYLVRFG